MKRYDIIVIGAGSGGLSVGLFLAKLKLNVLMIDRSASRIGGECLNDGCIPSKALIHVARQVGGGKEAGKFGFTLTGKADMKVIREYIRSRQDIIRTHEDAHSLEEAGIDFVAGEASFEDKKTIRVGKEVYTAKKIVLATGSIPRPLQISGLENIPVYNNENIFDIDSLPERLVIIGAGATGLELAQAFQQLGCQVSVIEAGSGVLPAAGQKPAQILETRLKRAGVDFYLDCTAISCSAEKMITIRKSDETTFEIVADAIFSAMGRTFDLTALQLEKAGIAVVDGRIRRDDYLRTSNPIVWVCGDVAGSWMFSHAAEQHARLLLNNFFSPFKKKLNNDRMSWVVFTDPEVARFGLSEQQLKQNGRSFEKLSHDFTSDDRAVTDDYQYGYMEFFLSKKQWLRKQTLLGGILICPGAGEMIQELILASYTRTSILAILKKVYPYPVASRVNQAILARYKSRQLTPFILAILRRLFRFG